MMDSVEHLGAGSPLMLDVNRRKAAGGDWGPAELSECCEWPAAWAEQQQGDRDGAGCWVPTTGWVHHTTHQHRAHEKNQ